MYAEESLVTTPSSRNTMTMMAATPAATPAANTGVKSRDRVTAAIGAHDDADAAAKSIPQDGAMTSMVTRLLLMLRKW